MSITASATGNLCGEFAVLAPSYLSHCVRRGLYSVAERTIIVRYQSHQILIIGCEEMIPSAVCTPVSGECSVSLLSLFSRCTRNWSYSVMEWKAAWWYFGGGDTYANDYTCCTYHLDQRQCIRAMSIPILRSSPRFAYTVQSNGRIRTFYNVSQWQPGTTIIKVNPTTIVSFDILLIRFRFRLLLCKRGACKGLSASQVMVRWSDSLFSCVFKLITTHE